MQSVTSSDLNDLMPNTGDTATLVDRRDGEEYIVSKLADGHYWMLDNLRLDPVSVPLANLLGNTNASNTTLGYFKNGNGSSPYPAVGVNTTWDSEYDEPEVNTTYKDTTATSYGVGSGKRGVYYNYCAATAGSYCYAQGQSTGDATEDVCPYGWRLPTSGDNGEYRALCTVYNGSDCGTGTTQTPMDAASTSSLQYNLSTPLAGGISAGEVIELNGNARFWSSTLRSANVSNMASLRVTPSVVVPSGGTAVRNGYSVRCIFNY